MVSFISIDFQKKEDTNEQKENNHNIYFSIIPDKNYFMVEDDSIVVVKMEGALIEPFTFKLPLFLFDELLDGLLSFFLLINS